MEDIRSHEQTEKKTGYQYRMVLKSAPVLHIVYLASYIEMIMTKKKNKPKNQKPQDVFVKHKCPSEWQILLIYVKVFEK
jgi:hypothetical protein